MRIAFVVAGGVDRSGRESVTPAILWLIERIVGRHDLSVYVLRYHDRACTYPLLGATIRDLGSPRGLRRQYDALVDALRWDGPFDVVHGYQALPSGLTRDKRRSVRSGVRPAGSSPDHDGSGVMHVSGEPSGHGFTPLGEEESMLCLWTSLGIGFVLITTVASPAAAQDLKPAVFAVAAAANVYRSEDQSFGTELNVGAGLGIEWKRLSLDAEVHRTMGLTPRTVQCGIRNVPCVGSAREGFLAATMFSGNVSYSFGGPRVRPYVTGSVGVLWTESVNSLTIASSTAAILSEFHETDRGLAIGVGFGVDVALTAAFSLRPEFRTYSSVAMSRVNLGLHRGAIGVRYRW